MDIRSSRGEYHLTSADGWRMIVIVILYGVLSFFHLGNLESPQSFWVTEESDRQSVVLDLGTQQEVSYIRQFTGPRFGNFKISISDDGITYSSIDDLEQEKVFAWQDIEINKTCRYIKMDVADKKGSIGEIGVYNAQNQKLKVTAEDEVGKLLVDEQNVIPSKISYMNTTYFDEIYHGRTAYEYIHGMKIYEWTHPPLGKLIMTIPIRLLGMNPFAFRVMGNIVGIAMLVVMYIFAKRLFRSTRYATLAMLLFAVDGMHFVQTRIGTVDCYLVFFIMLSYLFMYQYTCCDAERSTGKMHLNLLGSGFFMGCAIATKWNGAYTAVGLAIIFFINFYMRNRRLGLTGRWREARIGVFFACILYFIVLPALIYILSYIPDMQIDPAIGTLKGFMALQQKMYKYHSELKATHPFSSPWYLWPLGIKPLWYYKGSAPAGKISSITLHSNPFIWWTGLLAMLYTFYKAFIDRSKQYVFLTVAILAAYIPYIGVPRIMFIYHYFPVVPMMILAIVGAIKDIEEDLGYHICKVYGIIALVIFAFFYPIYSGLVIPKWYASMMVWIPGIWKLY